MTVAQALASFPSRHRLFQRDALRQMKKKTGSALGGSRHRLFQRDALRLAEGGSDEVCSLVVIACFSVMPCGLLLAEVEALTQKVVIACFSVMPCGSPSFGALARKDLGGVKRQPPSTV